MKYYLSKPDKNALFGAVQKLCKEEKVEEDNDDEDDLNVITCSVNSEDLSGSTSKRPKISYPDFESGCAVDLLDNGSKIDSAFLKLTKPRSRDPNILYKDSSIRSFVY